MSNLQDREWRGVGRGNAPGTRAALAVNAQRARDRAQIEAAPRWDKVLNLWAKGLTSHQIAEATRVPRNSVCRIARQARANGDPRAASRGMPAMLAAGKGLPA